MNATDIRSARKNAGIRRQIELADELQINRATLVDIEAGRIGIDDETYTMIKDGIERLGGRIREEAAA